VSGGGTSVESEGELSGLVFPNPLLGPDDISAATLLYFDGPIAVEMPACYIPEGSYRLLDEIEKRAPGWKSRFDILLHLWGIQQDAGIYYTDLLKRLGNAVNLTMLAFPVDEAAMARARDLMNSANLGPTAILANISIPCAAFDFFRHLLLETYLEVDEDIDALFHYTDQILKAESVDSLLLQSHLTRALLIPQMVSADIPLLINSPGMQRVLEAVPVDLEEPLPPSVARELVAWEVFRQLVKPVLDPMDAERVERIALLREEYIEERDALRLKCRLLSEEIDHGLASRLDELQAEVHRLIQLRAKDEISELLRLNRESLRQFLEDLLSDQVAWSSAISAIAGALTGTGLVAAGGVIAGLTSLGAKASAAAFERTRRLRTSEYRMIYRASRI
jgi:hypothetical protein